MFIKIIYIFFNIFDIFKIFPFHIILIIRTLVHEIEIFNLFLILFIITSEKQDVFLFSFRIRRHDYIRRYVY